MNNNNNKESYTMYENEARDWSFDDAIEVSLKDESSFLKIKETLTRIGISNSKEKKLFQTAHILHKQGRYYIVHFKLLFALDGRPAQFNIDDWKRQNTIATLLEQWGLVRINGEYFDDDFVPVNNIKIIKHADKGDWDLITKYSSLGKRYRD